MKNREWRQMVLYSFHRFSLAKISNDLRLCFACGCRMAIWAEARLDGGLTDLTLLPGKSPHRLFLFSGFAVFVALFNLLWVNRATQGRAFSDVTIALLLKSWKKGKGHSRSKRRH